MSLLIFALASDDGYIHNLNHTIRNSEATAYEQELLKMTQTIKDLCSGLIKTKIHPLQAITSIQIDIMCLLSYLTDFSCWTW